MRKKQTYKRHVILRSSGLLIIGVLLLAGGRALRNGQALPDNSASNQAGAWNMILVNAQNPIPDGFETELADISGGHRVDARIASSLEAMLDAARQQGLDPVVCSSYRTRQKQQETPQRAP